jgi:hypothetical protein
MGKSWMFWLLGRDRRARSRVTLIGLLGSAAAIRGLATSNDALVIGGAALFFPAMIAALRFKVQEPPPDEKVPTALRPLARADRALSRSQTIRYLVLGVGLIPASFIMTGLVIGVPKLMAVGVGGVVLAALIAWAVPG